MQGDAVHDRGHAELAHAVADVVRCGTVVMPALAGLGCGEIGAGQIGRAAEQLRHRGHQCFERDLRGLARRDRCRDGGGAAEQGFDRLRPACRQRAELGARELRGFGRILLRVGGEARVPLRFPGAAGGARIPGLADVVRNLERRMAPAECDARRRDLGRAECGAVYFLGAGLVRRAPADLRSADDQRRLAIARFGGLRGRFDCSGVMPVDRSDHAPAVGAEARRRVVAEPALDFTVDRDAVVVVVADQLVEPEHAGQRGDFMADAFHQTAVAEEDPGAVIDELEALAIEARGEQLLGECHADRIGDALAERAGRGFHTRRDAVLRMAGRLRVQLAKALELVERQVIAAQVQQRVVQHRAMAVRHDEAVAIGPLRVGRTVAQMIAPEHFGNIGHAHRHAGMAGLRRFHGVDREEADGVGEATAGVGSQGFAHVGSMEYRDAAIALRARRAALRGVRQGIRAVRMRGSFGGFSRAASGR